jgi:hypothetical protein
LSSSDPDASAVPVGVVIAALLGFAGWLAAANKLGGRGEGWILDTLLGLFLAAVLAKWGMLLGMGLRRILIE